MKLLKKLKILVCLILNDSSNDSEKGEIALSYKTKRIVILIGSDLFYDFKKIKGRNGCITAVHIYTKSSTYIWSSTKTEGPKQS